MRKVPKTSPVGRHVFIMAGVFFALPVLPALLVADNWYYGAGFDSLTWSQEGKVDSEIYHSLDAGAGLTFLLGYRFSDYFALETFGYNSTPASLKESDTDHLQHFMIGFGPRINLLSIRQYRWTPWLAYYGTYHSIDRYRKFCCEDSPVLISTLMEGMGRTRAAGVDIEVHENTLLQIAVRESTVWAGWDIQGMDDAQTIAQEIFIALNFTFGQEE